MHQQGTGGFFGFTLISTRNFEVGGHKIKLSHAYKSLNEKDLGPSRVVEVRKDSAGHYVTSTPVDIVALAREILAWNRSPGALS
jgi:hypothetical protein